MLIYYLKQIDNILEPNFNLKVETLLNIQNVLILDFYEFSIRYNTVKFNMASLLNFPGLIFCQCSIKDRDYYAFIQVLKGNYGARVRLMSRRLSAGRVTGYPALLPSVWGCKKGRIEADGEVEVRWKFLFHSPCGYEKLNRLDFLIPLIFTHRHAPSLSSLCQRRHWNETDLSAFERFVLILKGGNAHPSIIEMEPHHYGFYYFIQHIVSAFCTDLSGGGTRRG